MSTLAILPVKSFGSAKGRLAEQLDPGPRRALAEAMFADVLIALRRAARIDAMLVVSADSGAQQLAGGHGAAILPDDDQGHSEAATRGIVHAQEQGFTRVLLVPGDCPLLAPAELDDLMLRADRLPAPSVLIVPDRHGTGTNALVLSPPTAMRPSFGEGSRERHEQFAREAGVQPETVTVPGLALDVDTPEDLTALQDALARSHGGAAHTRGMLNQLLRSRS